MTKDNAQVLPITVSDTSKGKSTRQAIKLWSVIILIVQNTVLVLMMRYSRTITGPLYSTTSCVFIIEIVKVLICLGIIFVEKNYSTRAFFSVLHSTLLGSPVDTLKMLIPATIYAIQNNLLFIALSNLDAAVYQVTYQLKILTTAMFSVTMLRKELARHQWFALILLMMGVTLVQLELQAKKSAAEGETVGNPLKGLIAVLLACFSSGFAGVYFEKVVKSAESNIWVRNIQLGIFGAMFSFVAMIVQEGSFIWENGMLYGYTWIVWGVVFMQALGGLIVAVVVKYADNILKGFATSLSILLSSVVAFMLTNFMPSLQFISGTMVVLFSVYLYSLPK